MGRTCPAARLAADRWVGRLAVRLCCVVMVALGISATIGLGASGPGTITTIAGTGLTGYAGDGGPATAARLYATDVAVDGAGNVYIADNLNRVRKIDTAGTISTIAGGGANVVLVDGMPATSASLLELHHVAVDGLGNVYFSLTTAGRVMKVSPDGKLTTFAGGVPLPVPHVPGTNPGDGGPATSSPLLAPSAAAVDALGNVYIADQARVRKVRTDGTIVTIAGTGIFDIAASPSPDGGPATSAGLLPSGVAVDGAGNVYITESSAQRIRRVGTDGTITTIAGTTGVAGLAGDGGPATSAKLLDPMGLVADGIGNVYIGDWGNHRVRKVSPGGTITTVAGNASPTNLSLESLTPLAGDGRPATAAPVDIPWSVALDRLGNLLIADGPRVRKVFAGSATSTGLQLVLRGASQQQLLAQKAITVTARCNTACSLVATGVVRILGTRTFVSLRGAKAHRDTAGSRTLRLRLSPAAHRRLGRLLKPGVRARATITVRATDATGHKRSASRRVDIVIPG